MISKPECARLLPDDFPAKYLEPPHLCFDSKDILPEDQEPIFRYFEFAKPFLAACTVPVVFPMIGRESSPVFISGVNLEHLKPLADCLGVPSMQFNGDTELKAIQNIHNNIAG